MGKDWKAVFDLWWCLEKEDGFKTSTKSHRPARHPKQVGIWVKNARIGTPVFSVEVLSNEWWAWWMDINPKWRVKDGKLVEEGDGNWECLRCPGQNGWLNILVCLKWWYGGLDGESQDWLRAIMDVKWALEGLLG
ncbi:hypothetical protein C8R44DRAFT_638607 [Mycena epipterygia]|nr:hypothetical protein C8R44DRAFT_638607 [Mycena epipterygia]